MVAYTRVKSIQVMICLVSKVYMALQACTLKQEGTIGLDKHWNLDVLAGSLRPEHTKSPLKYLLYFFAKHEFCMFYELRHT